MRLPISVSILAMAAMPAHALELISDADLLPGESVFEFNQQLSSGDFLFGFLVGEDTNNDGVLESTRGEVRLLRAEVVEFLGTVTPITEFEETDFTTLDENSDEFEYIEQQNSIVRYHLDGSGFIGDRAFGPPERFALFGGGIDGQDIFLDETFGLPILGCSESDPFGINCGPGLYRAEGADLDGDGEPEDYWEPQAFLDAPIVVTSGPRGDALGVTEAAPLLPEDGPPGDNGFSFDVPDEIPPGEFFFIDPDVAVGYEYSVEGTEFTGVQAPSLDAVPEPDGAFELIVNGISSTLLSSEVVNFGTPVSSFTILGIDTALMLDPTDPLAFVTGIALVDPSAATSLFQLPITQFVPDDTGGGGGGDGPNVVPLPPAALMLAGALFGLGALRRRRVRG